MYSAAKDERVVILQASVWPISVWPKFLAISELNTNVQMVQSSCRIAAENRIQYGQSKNCHNNTH